MSSTRNGAVILKSFADLSHHIDVESLPPGPSDRDEPGLIAESDSTPTKSDDHQETALSITSASQPLPPQDLASVIAQLASLSNSLELAAREDARAREQATIELARYQTLAAERHEAERALAEAREVCTAAELLSSQAFTEEARAQAARNAAVARAAELACAELLAERTRAADQLASRPHLARVIADQRRRQQEQAEAARRAGEERTARLAQGLAATRAELAAGNLDEARRLLAPLSRDFPTDDKVQSVLDTVRWQAQQLVVAPAQTGLREARRALRESVPERAIGRLADVQMHGLPDDLARQVFGVWSNACYWFVQQLGWLEPLRYSIVTSRGAVLAKPTAEAPHQVLSALSMGRDWFVGKVVTDAAVLDAARPLRPPKAAS
jgi:hypothetical protein